MNTLGVFLLLSVSVAVVAAKTYKCESKDRGMLTPFSKKNSLAVMVPCKYQALKHQKCGDYFISLYPTNIWLGTNYYLNSMWVGVENSDGKRWEGRTTNKKVLKFVGDKKMDMFHEMQNDLKASTFKFDVNGKNAYLEDKKKNFKITYTPWNPDTKRPKHANFKFECFKEMDQIPYPEQFCGTEDTNIEDYADSIGWHLKKNHRDLTTYVALFNSSVGQPDEKCKEAATIFKDVCGDDVEKQRLVMENCAEILHEDRHTDCITSFTCDPMDAFNACLTWGCKGNSFDKKNTAECKAVGEAIDLCGDIVGAGNITERMRDAKCYTEFLDIKVPYVEDDTEAAR